MVLLVTLAAVTSGVGAAPADPRIALRALEFRFIPPAPVVPPGDALVFVRNEGEVEHNLVIEDAAGRPVAEIASVLPERTEQVRVRLRAGLYPFYCNMPGHRDLGMHGVLAVRE